MIETKALRRSNVVKTALLRSVSHDLRSPLTAITAAAAGLGSDDALAEERARAHLGDQRRERAAVAPGRQPARPVAAPGGRGRAARDWCSVEEVIARRDRRACPRPPGGFDVQIDAGPAADPAPTPRSSSGRSPTCSRTPPASPATSRWPSARAPRPARSLHPVADRGPGIAAARSSSGSSSRSIALRRGRRPGSGLGLAIARGFSRRTAAGSGPSRCRARARRFVLQLPVPTSSRPARAEAANAAACSSATTSRRSCARCGSSCATPASRWSPPTTAEEALDAARAAAAGRGDPRPDPARRRRRRRLPLDPRVERDADPRAVGGRRGGGEGARARGRRRRLRDQAVRARRADRPAAARRCGGRGRQPEEPVAVEPTGSRSTSPPTA